MKKIIILLVIFINFSYANKKFDGIIKHISYLSDYDVLEIESFINEYETIFIAKNRNNNDFKVGDKVKGFCTNKKTNYGEYTDCPTIKIWRK